jgi:hypothetical protein
VGCCEQGNEASGPIKEGNFLIIRVTNNFSIRTVLHGVT